MVTVRMGRKHYSRHREIITWLFENIGTGGDWKATMPDGWDWDFMEMFGEAEIRFRREEDAVLFKLSWL